MRHGKGRVAPEIEQRRRIAKMVSTHDDDDWDAFARAQSAPTEPVTHEERVRLILDWRKAFADTSPDERQSALRLGWLVVIAFISGAIIGGTLVGWLVW